MNAIHKLLCLVPVALIVTGCASSRHWNAAGGNRESGIVRLSYQYPEFRQPDLSDAQATELALNRCSAWGYARAQEIPGQVRECSAADRGNCTLWTVTREYQCSGDAKMANRRADGTLTTRLAPLRLAR